MEVGRWARGRERGAEVQPSVGSGDLGQDEDAARERSQGRRKWSKQSEAEGKTEGGRQRKRQDRVCLGFTDVDRGERPR